MSASLATVSYIAAIILFILSLGGLSNPETSRRGNLYGMIGMAIAVLATVFGPRVTTGGLGWIAIALVAGGAIGLYLARTVKMTQMPELVAFMHSLVGLVAMLVGYASYVDPTATAGMSPAEVTIHHVEVYVGVLIGAVTLSGSVIAFGKLSGRIGGKPLLLPARHWLNLAGLLVVLWFGYKFLGAHSIQAGHDADHRDERDRAPLRHPHGDGDRRRGHAGGRLDAEQLLRMGRGGHRLHALERPADRDRRARRLLRRDPVVHHVPRDEPQLHQRDRGRVRRRDRRPGGRRRGAARGRGRLRDRAGNRRPAARGEERGHRARLRHGGRPGAAHGLRDHQAAARPRQDGALRHPPGRRAHAGPHERAARRGQGALRHRARDGRDQRATSPTPTSP